MSGKQKKAIELRTERFSKLLKIVLNTDITSTKKNWISSLENGSWDSRYESLVSYIERKIESNRRKVGKKTSLDRNYLELVSANID